MRKLYLLLPILLCSYLNTNSLLAQEIQQIFTICPGETVFFPAPPNFANEGEGNEMIDCPSSDAEIIRKSNRETLPYAAGGFSFQPEQGKHVIITRAFCRISTATGSRIEQREKEYYYEVRFKEDCAIDTSPIFTEFPWLSDLVNPNDCSVEAIEVFQSGTYKFLFFKRRDFDQTLYFQDGTRYCRNAPAYDCLAAYGLANPITTWNCGDNIEQQETGCFITITNTQCRVIDVFDNTFRLLTTLESGPFGNAPLGSPTPEWTDPKPLADNERRTYIFKEGDFTLTRKTVTCAQPAITTANAFAPGCNDGLSLGVYTNTGCRAMTIVNTNSDLIGLLTPDNSITLTATNQIYIFLIGTDTVAIKSDVGGDIDSGGCDGTTQTNAIPDDFREYNVILRVCKGESISIRNPFREVVCPITNCRIGPCEPGINFRYAGWSGGPVSVATSSGISTVTFSPTQTTIYTSSFRDVNCNQGSGPGEPAGPAGPAGPEPPKYTYLVIVDDHPNCLTTSQTSFDIEACIGEIITIPIPNHIDGCSGVLPDNSIGTIRDLQQNYARIQITGGGTFSSILGDNSVRSGGGIFPLIGVSCPETIYEYTVRIKSPCVDPPANNAVFNEFSWLRTKVSPTNCSTESVALYQQGVYQYLLITDAQGQATLYNQDGLFYCQNANNFDCVSAYNFGSPILTWSCGGSPPPVVECTTTTGTIFLRICNGVNYYLVETEDGRLFDPYLDSSISYEFLDGQKVHFDYVDAGFVSPCSLAEQAITITCIEIGDNPTANGDCSKNLGEITFNSCDDGTSYFFLQHAETGELFDIYFAEGVSFTPKNNQAVMFDYVPAHFESPCSLPNQAVIITCIEEVGTEEDITNGIFPAYPFLYDLIDVPNCERVRIEVYEQGAYSYIFIGSRTEPGVLYFEDGTFYCQNSTNYDCREVYGLSNRTNSWTCSNFQAEESTERNSSSSLIEGFSVYPNPTLGNVIINVAPTADNQQLQIFDMLGRVVQHIDMPATVTRTTVEVDLSKEQNGVYYVQLRSKGLRVVQKIVKQDLE